MKIFKPRSMMQEHRSLIKRASTSSRRDSWTALAPIFGIVGKLLRCPLDEGIHKEAHLYCKGDLEPLSSCP
jgi:hypothetical protein